MLFVYVLFEWSSWSDLAFLPPRPPFPPPWAPPFSEEMTEYVGRLVMERWISPHVDTGAWRFFDLSCVSRDATEDQVLRDAVAAGAELGEVRRR